MAVSKPTTTGDLKAGADAPAIGSPEADRVPPVDRYVEVEGDAPKDPTKYVTLTSPTGAKTKVPDSIVGRLRESGYKG